MTKRTTTKRTTPRVKRSTDASRASSADPSTGRRTPETTRKELLAAGRWLFGSLGIYESRIEDITEQAGIAKGTIYLHFRSKEDLLEAVTRAGLLELQESVKATVSERHELADALAEALRAHLLFFHANPDLMHIFHQVRGVVRFDRPAYRPLRALLQEHVEFLAECLVGSGSRALTPARRRALATLVFGLASGAASVHAVIYQNSADLAELARSLTEPLSRALAEVSASTRAAGRAKSR